MTRCTIRVKHPSAKKLQQAITLAGGASVLSNKMGVSKQAICKWGFVGVPVSRVRALCELTDWQITPFDLRPDVWAENEGFR